MLLHILAKSIPISEELINHQVINIFQSRNVRYPYPKTSNLFLLKSLSWIEFSKNNKGIRAPNIIKVKPFIGQAAESSKADRIDNKKCLVVLDISTNLNFLKL